jgi:mannosyltransferase OCH1-like enzyme
MIPKTIHYLWLSKEKPEKIISCLKTWAEHLKDYEIIEWNDKTFPYNDFLWTKEAFSVQKWAFVTDFFRLWVLKKYGGIYLDADIVVNSNFDAFLNHKLFIGAEFAHQLGPHAIGSEPGHPFISRCLEYYDNRHFITVNKYCETPLPIIITKIFMKQYNYSGRIISFNNEPVLFDDIVVYNDTFFTVNIYNGKNICYHNYLASWVEDGQKFTLGDATANYIMKKYFCYDIFNGKKIIKYLMLILPMFVTTLILKFKLSIKNHLVIKKANIENIQKCKKK